jgi:hypothetical protein
MVHQKSRSLALFRLPDRGRTIHKISSGASRAKSGHSPSTLHTPDRPQASKSPPRSRPTRRRPRDCESSLRDPLPLFVFPPEASHNSSPCCPRPVNHAQTRSGASITLKLPLNLSQQFITPLHARPFNSPPTTQIRELQSAQHRQGTLPEEAKHVLLKSPRAHRANPSQLIPLN